MNVVLFYCMVLMVLMMQTFTLVSSANIHWNGIADDKASANNNTAGLNLALDSLQPGDSLSISNQTFWLNGGVFSTGLKNNTIVLDGTLIFLPDRKATWIVDTFFLLLLHGP